MQNNIMIELINLLNTKKTSKNLSELDIKKINNLDYLLKDEQLFFKVDFNTAIGILNFLGITGDKAFEYYYELISPKNFKTNDNTYVTISNK